MDDASLSSLLREIGREAEARLVAAGALEVRGASTVFLFENSGELLLRVRMPRRQGDVYQ